MLERFKQWMAGEPPARILLAEDDAEMRDMLSTVLRRDGHEVVEAEDGPRLLAEVQAAMDHHGTPPDLIISDVRMPGFGGLYALAALRSVGLEIPVILITGFGDATTHAEAFELGATIFDKPFPLDALRATVRCLVA